MTLFSLLLLGHILGTVALVGGAFMLQILAVLASRSGAPAELAVLARQAAWIGPRVFLPAAVLIVISGLLMASQLGYGLDEPFLLVGLGVIGVAAVTGPAFLAPVGAHQSPHCGRRPGPCGGPRSPAAAVPCVAHRAAPARGRGGGHGPQAVVLRRPSAGLRGAGLGGATCGSRPAACAWAPARRRGPRVSPPDRTRARCRQGARGATPADPTAGPAQYPTAFVDTPGATMRRPEGDTIHHVARKPSPCVWPGRTSAFIRYSGWPS